MAPDASPPALPRARLWLLALGFIVIWLLGLGFRVLIKTDEGRYAEIAREMLVSGDWLTPRLNDLLYFEKPPLQYWATAAAFAVFGLQDWAARLWTGLSGLLAIAITGWCATRLYGAAVGWLSAAMLASCLGFFAMGHLSALDMGFSAMLTVALCALLTANRGTTERVRRRWMLVCWAGMALALLSKGVAGIVLPATVLVIYVLTTRDWTAWRKAYWRSGLVLLLLIAAPWFILLSQRQPDFARFFFIHEHVERFLTPGHAREGAWWYFGPILLAGLFPWTLLLPAVLAQGWRLEPRTETADRFQPTRLLWIWSVTIFVFFSFSHSKLPSYIVPIFPALAILAARQWLNGTARARHTVMLTTLGLGVLALAFSVYYRLSMPGDDLYSRYAAWLIGAGAVLATACGMLWVRRATTAPFIQGMALATAALIAHSLILWGHDTYGQMVSAKNLAAELRPLISADDPVYSVKTHEQTLPYYLQRPVTLVAYYDEFSFGLRQEPTKGIARMDDFLARWRNPTQAWAYMKPDTYHALVKAGVPLQLRFINEDHAMVSRL
ncbi:MAG: phospholipid carrier-dependent glycosyltransferase [Burkholderiaceae bacterium]|jgi:4-amino-4-deoxy-L-arabinose transferase-like glycosyltransferase